VSGVLERLTTGSGDAIDPTCAGGNVAFTNIKTRQDIWLLPFDLNRGMSRGGAERISVDGAVHRNPSLSGDGRHLGYLSDRFGPGNIRLRELATGQEISVAPSTLVQAFPVSNASGSRVAFSAYENDKRVVYVSAPGAVPERVCEDCLRATDWSLDEKSILVFGGNPYGVDMLDLTMHQRSPLLRHPTHHLLYARFSPDGKWVSFTIRTEQNRGRIAIAPLVGQKPVPQESWIQVADVSPDDYAHWSPDGKTLYFSSDRDGYACIWGRRLDPVSRRPVGDVFPVQHFHGLLSFGHGGWSATAGRIAISLVERTGNVWMMSR
jgi:Tol biopolymer transport system component